MKPKKYTLKSLWVKIILIVCLVFLAFFVRSSLERVKESASGEVPKEARESGYAISAPKENKILQAVEKQYPEAEVILACEEDVTNDGCKDLVVIYREGDETRTVIAVDSGDGKQYNFTEPIPAPVENQKIQFKNIDKENEIEIVITGEKNGAVGYAIYRMIEGEPVDLFGEGMADCC